MAFLLNSGLIERPLERELLIGLQILDLDKSLSMQALAEKESEGMAKLIYRNDTGEILGVHIIGLHAADLIHEASNAVATQQTVQVCSRESPVFVAFECLLAFESTRLTECLH